MYLHMLYATKHAPLTLFKTGHLYVNTDGYLHFPCAYTNFGQQIHMYMYILLHILGLETNICIYSLIAYKLIKFMNLHSYTCATHKLHIHTYVYKSENLCSHT